MTRLVADDRVEVEVDESLKLMNLTRGRSRGHDHHLFFGFSASRFLILIVPLSIQHIRNLLTELATTIPQGYHAHRQRSQIHTTFAISLKRRNADTSTSHPVNSPGSSEPPIYNGIARAKERLDRMELAPSSCNANGSTSTIAIGPAVVEA